MIKERGLHPLGGRTRDEKSCKTEDVIRECKYTWNYTINYPNSSEKQVLKTVFFY